jgi:hypothetical protein
VKRRGELGDFQWGGGGLRGFVTSAIGNRGGMGSPGAILALADLVGAAEGVFEELTGSLQGWKRKVRRAANSFLSREF